jgi:hypothetical protein
LNHHHLVSVLILFANSSIHPVHLSEHSLHLLLHLQYFASKSGEHSVPSNREDGLAMKVCLEEHLLLPHANSLNRLGVVDENLLIHLLLLLLDLASK